MQKGAGILIKTLYIIYISLVLFFCLYNFSSSGIDLARYFMGIRFDRYAHFAMFFPYPFIAWLTFRYSRHFSGYRKYSLLATFISGIIFAFLSELFQEFLTVGRDGDPIDFVADICAIAVGTAIVAVIGRWMVRITEKLFNKQ